MDLKLILEQATFEALKRPEKRTVNRTVKPWVKIEPMEGKKPKFRLSSSAIELVKNETDHVFIFVSNSELYIASPGYWGTSTETEYFPDKKMESRIITHGVEMTRAVLDRVPVESYSGEWLLEFQGEVEVAHQKLEKNVLIKAFKLIKDAITTGEADTSVNDGLDNNETSSTGIESGVLNSDSNVAQSGDSGLLENEVF